MMTMSVGFCDLSIDALIYFAQANHHIPPDYPHQVPAAAAYQPAENC
jgi:hypothetical protein